MKKFLVFIMLCFFHFGTIAQVNPALNELVINATAKVSENPATVQLNWTYNGSATGDYRIARRTNNSGVWKVIATLSNSDSTYLDEDVIEGVEYEYRLYIVNGPWGYITSGVNVLPKLMNRGIILVLDTGVTNQLTLEINQLIEDLEADGFFVETIESGKSDSVVAVKDKIVSVYNQHPEIFNSLLSIGHVPVPYSGNLNPDAHNNHKGAWSADIFYGDIDGNWTDASINNTSASRAVNQNVPGDGKYDQSLVPSDLEMEVGRVDFYDMPAFGISEVELTRKYLNKNHAFRSKEFVPGRRGLMDEGSFANNGALEGFGQTAPRAMIPLIGQDSFIVADYFTTLTNKSYLWSYGQGAGSYTSCSGVGNTADFVNDSVQSVFTCLFGSYFGDYDSQNNFMRASLGSGTILTCSWSSSRPVWYYHHMAMGRTIGYSARRSVNYDNSYDGINFGASFPTTKGVHTVLLGDPTLRPFYVLPPKNLVAADDGNGDAALTWDASSEPTIVGYNIYRTSSDSINYKLINAQPVNQLSYTDRNISYDGTYQYFVRAVKVEETASGRYYNESPGVSDTARIVNAVGREEFAQEEVVIYPNPGDGIYNIRSSSNILHFEVYGITGKRLFQGRGKQVDMRNFESGIYLIHLHTKNSTGIRKIVHRSE